MPMVTRIAALHGALWNIDRRYRLSWYVWPGSLALLICGWISIDKLNGASATSPWAKPVAAAPAQPRPRSPVLFGWPEKRQDDVIVCFSYPTDPGPIVEACTRLIDSGQADSNQLAALYLQRGFQQRLKQPDSALADYNAALSIQPNAPAVLTNRAWIYMARSRYDAALEDLNKAINLFPPPQSARAHYYRGFSLMKLKDYDRAMTDLNQALELDPNGSDTYLARAEVEQAQQHYDAALRDLDEFGKRAPRDPRGPIGRSAVLEASGRIQEALAALDSVVALDPTNARALTARDRLRAHLNEGSH
jgi:tetratricopeptide (TPR) repeat protein